MAIPLFLNNKDEGSIVFICRSFRKPYQSSSLIISEVKASSSLVRVFPGTGGGAGRACQLDESSGRFTSSSLCSSLPSLCVSHASPFLKGNRSNLGEGNHRQDFGFGGGGRRGEGLQRKRICKR